MKKKVYGKKLSRNRNSRRALFRSLVRSLVLYGSIKTTKAKAKAIQGEIDRIVKRAQDKSIARRRQVYSILANDRATVEKLFTEIAPKLASRKSGFTKTTPLPARAGDRASMVRLEWVEKVEASDKQSASSKGKKAAKKKEKKEKAKEAKPENKGLKGRLSRRSKK